MDKQTYYSQLLERVNEGLQQMWEGGDPEDYAEDYEQLKGVLSAPFSEVSPETFMGAMEIFLNSFFAVDEDSECGGEEGGLQVWESIARHYEEALADGSNLDSFRDAFVKFSEAIDEDEMNDWNADAPLERMMELAVSDADREMARAIARCAFCERLYVAPGRYPRWAGWFKEYYL